jgi:translation initiation factor 4E
MLTICLVFRVFTPKKSQHTMTKQRSQWTIQVGKTPTLDAYWQNLSMALVGETLGDAGDICGAVLSKRKRGDRIEVWNRTAINENDSILKLGRAIKGALIAGLDGTTHTFSMKYDYHETALGGKSAQKSFSIPAGPLI